MSEVSQKAPVAEVDHSPDGQVSPDHSTESSSPGEGFHKVAEGDTSHGSGHGEGDQGGHGGGHPPEVPSGVDLVSELPFAQKEFVIDVKSKDAKTGEYQSVSLAFTAGEVMRNYQNQFYALLMVAVVGAILVRKLAKPSFRKPGRFQMLVEIIVGAFRDLVYGVLGEKNGRCYLPYVGSLFVFILLCNLMGLVPFLRSPTSVFQTTIALGICTFVYVQFTAFQRTGPLRYLYHMMGEPKGDSIPMVLFMWALGFFLLLPLHILTEFIKPVSLSLRLFGNILGEDILLGVFCAMGVTIMAATGWEHPWFGFPLHLPFFFLALLTSTVQALVFALLSMIYFLMVLPHDEEAH